MLSRINIVPRWIIFLLDVICCAIAVVTGYLLRFNFSISSFLQDDLAKSVAFTVIVYSIVFSIFRTYAGIIRYTSTQDSVRILFAVIVSTISLGVLNIIAKTFDLLFVVPLSILIISALTTFLLLLAYRMIVKTLFIYIKNLNFDKKNVIIFGAGQSGIITKRALDQDFESNMKVVAFLDDDERKGDKILEGIKIYNTKKGLEYLIKEHAIDELIISIQDLPSLRKIEIVDTCLANNIKVLNVPPVSRWINGELRSKQIRTINIEELLDRAAIVIDNEHINEQLQGKRVLITGAAGSIGSELVRQVALFNPDMIILCDQSETALYDLELEFQENNLKTNYQIFIGDVRNERRMNQLFSLYKPNFVYHAAAYKHVPLMENNPSEAVLTNILGTKIIADLCIEYGSTKFVMISTDKAVNPSNVMGASKRIAEIYIQALNNEYDDTFLQASLLVSKNKRIPKFITTRFGNVLGSNGSVIPRFKEQIAKGGPVTVTHPEITRYFMTIPEACQLVLEAGCMGKGGEIFIFDMGKSVKILELAKKMIRLSGFTPNKDIEITFTGLRPGEKLYEELLNNLENTVPTHNSKILIAKVREYHLKTINKQIIDLINEAKTYHEKQVVQLMKNIVPEFISNNSVFEELDEKTNIEQPIR